jgi:outer membrane protein
MTVIRMAPLALLSLLAQAEVHSFTLREAVELALQHNPDVVLSRLDERKAKSEVEIARDPFVTRIVAGSGLAFNNGFPLSIEGAAPSIFQVQASQFLLNRPQTWAVEQAREAVRGAEIGTAAKQDEAVYRVATLYLEAERAAREAAVARKQADNLEHVTAAVRARVEAGRELPLSAKRAAFDAARARQRVLALETAQSGAERSLAYALGLEGDALARPAAEQRPLPRLPDSEEAAVSRAVESNKDLERIESQLRAEMYGIRSQKATRLPRIDLIAKYAQLARFNNFEDFFRTFQRHNYLLGMSFQVPLPMGPADRAYASQQEINATRLRVERNSLRHRVSAETRRQYRRVIEAEAARDVARLDLEVAREEVAVLLARLEEGRVSSQDVEHARFSENEKWLAYYGTQYTVEQARYALLRQTGELVAALR